MRFTTENDRSALRAGAKLASTEAGVEKLGIVRVNSNTADENESAHSEATRFVLQAPRLLCAARRCGTCGSAAFRLLEHMSGRTSACASLLSALCTRGTCVELNLIALLPVCV